MEGETVFEKFADENRSIANKIQELFDEARNSTNPPWDMLIFRDSTDPYLESVNFTTLQNEDDMPTSVVGKLKPPAFLVNHFDYSKGARGRQATTSYGVLPTQFIAADGHLYGIDERYFFNEQGQAMKMGEIVQMGMEGDEVHAIKEGESYPRLDFTPGVGETVKLMGLTPGDYERIRYILHKIKSGEFAPFEASVD